MLLDTCFLIDLQREFTSGQVGPARAFLGASPDNRFAISVISAVEFMEGFADTPEGERLLRPFAWMDVDAEISRVAARIRRDLRLRGLLIGDFDILIAATAMAARQPLVTDNVDHFSRVDGLQVMGYR
jgi:predicted nucleic acid-binding protein